MKKVLIIVDMQNDFIYGSLGSPEAEKIIPKVKEKIEKGNYDKIIITLDTHEEKDYQKSIEGARVPQHCNIYTSGWFLDVNIMDLLLKIAEDKRKEIPDFTPPMLYKTYHKDTFGSFDLARDLRVIEDLEEIELVGLCTDICVISNALMLRSMLPNVAITIDSSCCAGTSIDNHKAALEVAKSCLIDII